jgi:acyl-CoA reductase-like NAD-dependent aldehyde dehydrogenase
MNLLKMERLRNFINGRWVESRSEIAEPDINPADVEDVLSLAPLSTREDTEDAVRSAQQAAASWAATPAPARGKILFRVAELLRTRMEEIAQILTREEGKTLADSRGEIQRAINILEFTAGEGRRLTGSTIPSELPRTFIYTLRKPVGVVGLITPWNFPAAVPVWKIAPALIAGNTVVLKPAELTPLTAIKIGEMFEEAGLPSGVLNIVLGNGDVVGEYIVNHPAVRAISFTGSNEVGCSIYEKGSQRGIRVQCEMGGKNPAVVLEDADLPLSVEGIIQGGFGSTGQRCTATSRVIVQERVADQVVQMLIARMANIRVGNGLDHGVDVGPLVDDTQLNTVLRFIGIGKEEGAILLKGGNRLSDGIYQKGFFLEPALFDHVRMDMKIAQEEIFGPVVCIIREKNFEDCLRSANGVRFGLSASIYSQNITKCMEFVDRCEVGKVHINSPTIGGEAQAPFGGTKATGIGPREMGVEALEFYTETRTVYLDYTGKKREGASY